MRKNNSNLIKSISWAIILITILITIIKISTSYVKAIKEVRDNNLDQFVSVNKNDAYASTNDTVRNFEKTKTPELVRTGIYLDRISNFDIIQSNWQYDYYQWFKWNPKKIKFINLQELKKGIITAQSSPFQIINGEIERIEISSYFIDDTGDSAYVNYFIKATSSNFFDVSTFPLDKQLLMINVEAKEFDLNELKFVPDSSSSQVSSRVSVNSYEIGNVYTLSKINTYQTDFGFQEAGYNASNFSQFRFGVLLKRDGYNYYFKSLIILIIIILISFLSFFAYDISKIPIVTGCLFATTASYYFYGSSIPPSSKITILELVYSVSLIIIFLIILQETVVKSIVRKNEKLYNSIRWITFVIMILFFLFFNYLIPTRFN
jgi:hypothetical protein